MVKEDLNGNPQVSEKTKHLILLIFPVACLLMAFIFSDINELFSGLLKIIISRDVLLTDYIEVGGLGATLLNVSLLTLINIYFLWKLKINIGGFQIAAIYTIAGFAFFGKNIVNVWPIYLGGYLYARYQKKSYRNFIIVSMFGTALAPMITEFAYASSFLNYGAIVIAAILGTVIGFVVPPIASHVLKAHDGYNLYNVGFAAGLIGTIVYSLMKSFGFVGGANMILSTDRDLFLKVFMLLFSIILIIIGYFLNQKSFLKGYSKILKLSGRAVSDFTSAAGIGMTLINMGIMGIIGLLYVIISKGVMNGPIVGGLLTIVGFAAFGKHPKNCLPIMIGVFLAAIVNVWDISSTATIIAGLFGTTLAPIAGGFGVIGGIIAGFIHLSVVMSSGALHGGMNLYNNGFSGGLVATILVPVLDVFKRRHDR